MAVSGRDASRQGGSGSDITAEVNVLEERKQVLQRQREVDLLEQEIAEAHKAIAMANRDQATAEREALMAGLSKGEAKAPAGETVAEDFGYVAELVAYHALRKAAMAIGHEIDALALEPKPAKILIVGERGFAQGDLPRVHMQLQFALFKDLLEKRTRANADLLGGAAPVPTGELEGAATRPEGLEGLEGFVPALGAAGMAVSGVGGLVSSIADVIGYFRTDYTIKGQSIELGSDALSAAVAGRITKHQAYLPGLSTIGDLPMARDLASLVNQAQALHVSTESIKSQIIAPAESALTGLGGETAALQAEIGRLGPDGDQAELVQLGQRIEAKKASERECSDRLDEAKAAVSASETLGKRFGDFVREITDPGDGGEPSRYAQAALRDHIHQQGITHLLHLEVLSSGGAAITKKRLWRSGEISFIGGCAASYMLATSAGQVVAGDVRVGLAQLDSRLSAPGAARVISIDMEV